MKISQWTPQEFVEEVLKFHGHAAPGVIIGGFMVEIARNALPKDTIFDAFSETTQCLPDAIQMLTPCTIGNGWLRILNFGIYALSLYDKYNGKGVRVSLCIDKLNPYPVTKSWILKTVPKKEQDPDKLRQEMLEHGQDMLEIKPIQIREHLLHRKGKGSIIQCPLCGDFYPAIFGRICRSCQGDSPYESGPGLSLDSPHLKAIPINEAVGQHFLHDMTKIVPEEFKGRIFKAGEQILAEDIERLQQIGRFEVYTEESAKADPNFVHEDIVAQEFSKKMLGENVGIDGEPKEGKVNFIANIDGLLIVDKEKLFAFNHLTDIMCATRHNMRPVRKGVRIAATRAVPLYLSKNTFLKAMSILDTGPLFKIIPMRKAKIGTLITGTEVFKGIIKDRFAPVIRQKAEQYSCNVIAEEFVPDEIEIMKQGIQKLIDKGADLIITTAGMSVDPGDITKKSLFESGLKDSLFGVPLLPGVMSLIGKIGKVQVLGVPACALFHKTTSLDILLPRILANIEITRDDLASLGHGGLCHECKTCDFPKCTFARS